MRFKRFFFTLVISILLGSSCNKNENGTVEFIFTHTVDGNSVQFNKLIYTNTAKNQYQINEIKYFISKITLYDANGKSVEITQDEGIHYVDCNLPNTLRWKIDDIPQGKYISISFIFGLNKEDNISNRFVNPPESNFSWPNHLGGGYHYMQINGKFLNKEGNIQNINIHTGTGQIYNANNEVVEFVHNFALLHYFIDYSIKSKTSITFNMEIQRWFDTPNLYNFDDFGTGIMQNQEAQKLLRENMWNLFEFSII